MSEWLSSFTVLIVVALMALLMSSALLPTRRRRYGLRKAKVTPITQSNAAPAKSGKRDAAEQLRCVMESEFTAQRLLSKREQRVLHVAEKAISEIDEDWRVMAQVSLGEVMKSNNKSAYWTVNAKRVDMLIVDAQSTPLAAIEYQGAGHHQKDAAARDAVKKEALRRAGIGYIEVLEGDEPDDLKRAIHRLAEKTRLRTAA